VFWDAIYPIKEVTGSSETSEHFYQTIYITSQTTVTCSHRCGRLKSSFCENSISLRTYKVGEEDLNIGCADLILCKGVNGEANIPYFRQICSPWVPREKGPWHRWGAGKYTPDAGPFPHGEPCAHTPPYVSVTQINIEISTGGSFASHIITIIQWQTFISLILNLRGRPLAVWSFQAWGKPLLRKSVYSLFFHSVHPVTNMTSDTSSSVYIPYIT